MFNIKLAIAFTALLFLLPVASAHGDIERVVNSFNVTVYLLLILISLALFKKHKAVKVAMVVLSALFAELIFDDNADLILLSIIKLSIVATVIILIKGMEYLQQQ